MPVLDVVEEVFAAVADCVVLVAVKSYLQVAAAVAIPNSVCVQLLLWPPWLWPFPAARGANLLKFRYSREVNHARLRSLRRIQNCAPTANIC